VGYREWYDVDIFILGTLKLTLTGHISTVRGVAVSDRHPYLFSCGEDKMVKCWDLEQNKVWGVAYGTGYPELSWAFVWGVLHGAPSDAGSACHDW
jgi:WD40 repeat protein